MRPNNTYKLRPAYGSENLLIEFGTADDGEYLLFEIMKLLSMHGFEQQGKIDLWMNDEILVVMCSQNGRVTLSLDVWGSIYILANNNQQDIRRIDTLLQNTKKFKKESVDFDQYRMPL
ncbi:hypothetical protein [Maribacter sp. 2-571]|uniref:hypothetical protein n=1 Tax=Maribacter sp. 2-571 TaxID=3417569 RepID=UPI003D3327D6